MMNTKESDVMAEADDGIAAGCRWRWLRRGRRRDGWSVN